MARLSSRALTAICAGFKLLQFMDRGVQNGSPLEFDTFIQRTTNSTAHTASLFGALTSLYTAGTVVGCVISAIMLGRRWHAHNLMVRGMATSGTGMLLSAFAYWMPSGLFTFVFYSAARVVVGVGGGCISLTWPSYVEATARASERSLSMALVETGTALGAAIGFVFSAAMSASLGWGAAYLFLAALMALLALPMATCHPPAQSVTSAASTLDGLRERLDGGGMFDGGSTLLMDPAADAAADTASVDSSTGEQGTSEHHHHHHPAVTAAAAAAAAACVPGPQSLSAASLQRSRMSSAADHAPPAPLCSAAWLLQLMTSARWLCGMPGLALFLSGCGFASACLQGLQVFFPAIAVEVGLWPDEVVAAVHFGGGIVVGAVAGGVGHGLLAERLVSRLSPATRERLPSLEGRVLALIVAATMLTGGMLSILLSRFITAHLATLTLLFIMLSGALLLGSLGLQIRTPLLLVPTSYRPAAILLGTLAGYIGEFCGPPAVGLLKEHLAPLCFTIERSVNGTVEEVVNPACLASPSNQSGLGVVLLLPSALAVVASMLWVLAACSIQPHALCATCFPRDGVAGRLGHSDGGSGRLTEMNEAEAVAPQEPYRSPQLALEGAR